MKTLVAILPKGDLTDDITHLLSEDFHLICTDSEEEGCEIVREKPDEISGVIIDLEETRKRDYPILNDVTEKELLKMELEKRSKTDPLTGLLNKGAVEELIGMMLGNYYKDNG